MKIKFYSINDISIKMSLVSIQKILKEYNEGRVINDINDLIEIYNINKFFDNELYLKDWTEEDIKFYNKIAKSYMGKIAIYFKDISDSKIREKYDEVHRLYKQDFWELISKFKVYENISHNIFKDMLNESEISLAILLRNKKITRYYGSVIREYMISDSRVAELLLDKYEVKSITEREKLNFPKELSISDKGQIINNYIDSEYPNLNYLGLISNIQSNKDNLELSPKTLLKAKKRIEELEKNYFKDQTGLGISTEVIFSKKQNETIIYKGTGRQTSLSYSINWIKDNQDNPTLLNNFIYLFNFVDYHMRCMLVSKVGEMGFFEKNMMYSKNAYITGVAFDAKNMLSYLQMLGYYRELFSLGLRLEEIIEWFFEEYLLTEFNIDNFKVIMPSIHSTYLEKCASVMPALESALKQFSLQVEEGHIDSELLEISSNQLIYQDIPSLVDKKYVYGIGDEFKEVTHLIFSNQSELSYSLSFKDKYTNFFELIYNEKVKINNYPKYAIPKINWLIENHYLKYDNEGFITFDNVILISIFKELYHNDVISYWKCSEIERDVMDSLEKDNIIFFESSLFSRPEQDYINYFLNRSKFNNGLDLRNKYSHMQPMINIEETQHEENYMIFLRIFIIAIIKINDDFCISEEINS